MLPDTYVQAGECLDHGGEVPDTLTQAIAVDLPARLTSARAFPAWDASIRLRRVLEAALVLFLILVTVALAASGTGLVALVAGMFTLVVVRHFVRIDRLHRQGRTTNHNICGACNYALRDLPDAIPPERTGAAHIGPRRCPECGLDWPGVPRLTEP